MFGQYSKTIEITARIILFVIFFEYGHPVLSLFQVSEAYAAEYLCGQDQNSDAFVDGAGETSVCIATAQGQLCPLGAVDCSRAIQNGTPGCSTGSTFNEQTLKCESPVVCPAGSVYNYSTNFCEITSSTQMTCSINNQVYASFNECNAVCLGTAPCSTSTPLPYSITYATDPDPDYYSNINYSKIVGSGDKLYFYQRYRLNVFGLYSTKLRATVIVQGATFSGTAYFPTGSALTVTSNQICANNNADCISVSGISLSGSILSGDSLSYPSYLYNNSSNALVTKYNGLKGYLYFNEISCPLPGGSACTGSPLQCSGSGTCSNTQTCPAGFSISNGVCSSSNVCSTGFLLNASTDLCEKTPDCTGTCNAVQINSVTKYQCSSTSTLFDSQALCAATCAVGVVCQEGDVCPLGSQYACMNNSGIKQCSPNTCVDISASTAEITEVDDSMFQDDGPRDSSGNCLGEIYIFTGRGMRCRPPGLQVGLINDCCQSDQPAISDSVGTLSDVTTAISTIQKVYDIVQVATYTNTILTSGVAPSGLATASSSVQAATYAGVMEGSVEAGMQSYMTSLLNPTTIAIAVVTMVVMRMLMGSGCDQKDIETSMLRDSEMCHFVGNYCAKKWPLVGCVQKAKGYCCYNSKMARIIHEQGRPQLIAFQPGGAWGHAQRPNCRGYSPEEFQQLDFSKIDLSEYFGDIQTKAQDIIQQGATDKINQFYQNIR